MKELNTLEQKDSFSFWKSLTLFIVFIVIAPVALGTSMFSLIALAKTNNLEPVKTKVNNPSFIVSAASGTSVFASLPSSYPSISGTVATSDARAEIIRQYLNRYNSPLEPYSQFIIDVSDKYGLDYRLLTAIAQQESNLCKKIPPGSYNCWGWGIHSKGTLKFQSFEEALETVARGIREEYIDKGYETPEEIMTKYTPLSNGSWAFGVNRFMNELQ